MDPLKLVFLWSHNFCLGSLEKLLKDSVQGSGVNQRQRKKPPFCQQVLTDLWGRAGETGSRQEEAAPGSGAEELGQEGT